MHEIDKPVLILGAGGHGGVLIEALRRLGVAVVGVLDSDPARQGSSFCDVPVLGDDDAARAFAPDAVLLANGIGSVSRPVERERIFRAFKDKGYRFVTIRHPDASLAEDAVLGEGCQILAGAVVQNGVRIGANSLANLGALIAHDCRIGDHVHIGPGAALSGNVRVSDGCHLGIGAAVVQGVTIGRGAVVGAGAVVLRDVTEGSTVVGIPARNRAL